MISFYMFCMLSHKVQDTTNCRNRSNNQPRKSVSYCRISDNPQGMKVVLSLLLKQALKNQKWNWASLAFLMKKILKWMLTLYFRKAFCMDQDTNENSRISNIELRMFESLQHS